MERHAKGWVLAIYRIHKLVTDPFIYVINKEKPACHPLGHIIVACVLIVEVDNQVAQAEGRPGQLANYRICYKLKSSALNHTHDGC